MKKTATINLMPEVLQIMETDAERLEISRNILLESQTILSAYERGLQVSSSDILGIVDGFSTNQNGKITAEFRNNIKAMPPSIQLSICAFFSGINLIGKMRVTTQKMANIWKDDEVICYFAINKIGGRDIETVIQKLSVTTIGNKESTNFIYFSKLQQFRIQNNYPKWPDFLNALNIPPSIDVIRVESAELMRIILPVLYRL